MVNDMDKAKRIQERRVAAGKRGYAKAVRRFLKRYEAEGRGGSYRQARDLLPVSW